VKNAKLSVDAELCSLCAPILGTSSDKANLSWYGVIVFDLFCAVVSNGFMKIGS